MEGLDLVGNAATFYIVRRGPAPIAAGIAAINASIREIEVGAAKPAIERDGNAK
jgi:hypothetical protein